MFFACVARPVARVQYQRVLLELVVENYAVVERAHVRFHRGLNLLTGETGSGKSIVVDALGLLLGGRASGDMVRSGAERARISGIFEPPNDAALSALLDEAGAAAEDGELLVEREVLANGKSRAFIGSRPVTATLLREMAPWLGDIHGQHDQQQLFVPAFQLAMLDAFADTGELLGRVEALFGEWKRCAAEIQELDRTEQETLRLADLWGFQRREIETASPKPGEDAELENEKRVLRNVARLQESANAAYASLYDAADSAATQLRLALKRIDELCRIDDTLQPVVEVLKPAEIAIADASSTLRDYLDRLEADPARLEDVESRLALLDRLKRKYGASIEEILAFLADVETKLDRVEHAGQRREQLNAELGRLEKDYRSAASRLTEARRRAAKELTAKLEKELASLALGGTRFVIEIGEAEWSANGADRVAFLISANVGEEPRPLEKIASGGELSRIALALRTSLGANGVSKAAPRTLVFDEVDSGIGGSVAEAVGRRLKRLSASNQVLCVTHLAQVASFADHHYVVGKKEVKGRTLAEVEELTEELRTREIGRMLSGQRITPEALKHAEQLIRQGARA